jgi:hypothetical protein
MLKVVIFVDCNECGLPMTKASVCSMGGEESWQSSIGLLIHDAEWDGWRFWREYVICPDCIEQELAMADYYEDLEGDWLS